MLGEVGFNGFELGFEGPLSKANQSSVLLNYRYSTLDLMDKLGMDFGTVGIPKYQDFSGKLTWPTKSGRFEMFSLYFQFHIPGCGWTRPHFFEIEAFDSGNVLHGWPQVVDNLIH